MSLFTGSQRHIGTQAQVLRHQRLDLFPSCRFTIFIHQRAHFLSKCTFRDIHRLNNTHIHCIHTIGTHRQTTRFVIGSDNDKCFARMLLVELISLTNGSIKLTQLTQYSGRIVTMSHMVYRTTFGHHKKTAWIFFIQKIDTGAHHYGECHITIVAIYGISNTIFGRTVIIEPQYSLGILRYIISIATTHNGITIGLKLGKHIAGRTSFNTIRIAKIGPCQKIETRCCTLTCYLIIVATRWTRGIKCGRCCIINTYTAHNSNTPSGSLHSLGNRGKCHCIGIHTYHTIACFATARQRCPGSCRVGNIAIGRIGSNNTRYRKIIEVHQRSCLII